MPDLGLILECDLTCPSCGRTTRLAMPTDEQVARIECPECGAAIRTDPGDCCAFCSHGSVPCPVAQKEFLDQW